MEKKKVSGCLFDHPFLTSIRGDKAGKCLSIQIWRKKSGHPRSKTVLMPQKTFILPSTKHLLNDLDIAQLLQYSSSSLGRYVILLHGRPGFLPGDVCFSGNRTKDRVNEWKTRALKKRNTGFP
ncbi:hypothetical protein CEXT_127311 [Caerostris extrusa]|uniref:Uncharacterized protein n=1 Tax=Caerostris extrusa TaxID=172846 RepID=A0AAV4Y388_CAEEX|nr:hypothetical protein CEXT_127311 [Caerostris extrusa]